MSYPSRLSLEILYLKGLIAADERDLRHARSDPAGERSWTKRRELQSTLGSRRLQLALLQGEQLGRNGYDPNQPRVPAGNPDGGQWTSSGGGTPTRLAAERPSRGPGFGWLFLLDEAKRLIDAYREKNDPRDLFGRIRKRVGTVTTTVIDDTRYWGINSTARTFTSADRRRAGELRDKLIEKYPDIMRTDNIGQKPNDAVFHAETTVLLRAARENGGTLAGRSLEVFGDRPLCPESCRKVLPYVGLELGNPTVTFVDPNGERQTMRDGAWDE
jgi:hypothetical protein